MTIWHMIPERFTMIKPKLGKSFLILPDTDFEIFITLWNFSLAFSSNEHGTSLNTFYERAGEFEPTVLVIKTNKQEVAVWYASI